MDWNWFFSSLAQSVAAIVGIFAAFIITKVINSQSEFSRKKERLREILSQSERFKDKFAERYFEWYSQKRLEDNLRSLENKLEEKQNKSPEEFYAEMHSLDYIPRKTVLSRINEVVQQYVPPEERDSSQFKVEYVLSGPERQEIRELQTEVWTEGDIIFSLISEVKHHVRIIKVLLSEIAENPESSSLVSRSIIAASVLFLLGVIFPLFFLPVYTSSTIETPIFPLGVVKIFLLLIVSIIFFFIMLQFWKVNQSLQYDEGDINTLKKFMSLGTYSTYLEIMENNASEIRAEKNKVKKKRRRKKAPPRADM